MHEHPRLFVYGTLRRGSGMESLLRGCHWLGEAGVQGTLYELDHYPAMTLEGTGLVRGELWSCPAETLAILDAYEGVAEGLFERVRVEVDQGWCWTYVAGPRLAAALTEERRLDPGEWRPRPEPRTD